MRRTHFKYMLQYTVLIVLMLVAFDALSDAASKRVIEVTLGDYRYHPDKIELIVNQPVVLHLVNTDTFTPHTFTLPDNSDGLDVDVDIPAGESVDVHLMPLVIGTHTFYCTNKLLFFENHREKGMEGTLTVIPANQASQP